MESAHKRSAGVRLPLFSTFFLSIAIRLTVCLAASIALCCSTWRFFHLTSEEVKHSEDNDKDQENDKNDICYDTPVHVDTSSVFTFALYHRALPVNYTIAGIKAQA